MKGQYRCSVLWALFSIFFSAFAMAGPTEDNFGANSRVQAMGGAGVAFGQDASSTFYNPAYLTKCLKKNISFGYQLIRSNLQVQDRQNKPVANKQIGSFQSGNIGVCLTPFSKAGFGFFASSALELPLQLPEIASLNSTPRFLKYGDSLAFPSATVGFAYAPIKQLSLGLSAMLSAGVSIQQNIEMPVVSSTVSPQLYPLIRLIAGISVQPVEEVRLSLVYRQASFGKFGVDVKTNITTGYGYISGSMPLVLESVLAYSPEQAAFGFAFWPSPAWLVGAEVTYYGWSKFNDVFMSASAKESTFISNLLTFPDSEQFNFRDIFVPRVGIERLLNDKMSVRVGYSFQPSVAQLPSGISNVLDNNVHRATIGGGYRIACSDNVTITMDAFTAVDVMIQGKVSKHANKPEPKHYTFGGTAMNAGLTFKIEY